MPTLDMVINEKLDQVLAMVKEAQASNARINAATDAVIKGLRAELEQTRQQLIEQRAEAWRLRRAWKSLARGQPVDAWGRVMVSPEYIARVLNGEEPCQ